MRGYFEFICLVYFAGAPQFLIANHGQTPSLFDPGRGRFVSKQLFDLFIPGRIKVPEGLDFDELNYQLFVPEIEDGRKYPLVVSLNGHDHTQLEYFNVGQLKHLQETFFLAPSSSSGLSSLLSPLHVEALTP